MQEKKYRDELLNKIEKEAHDYERDFHGCSRCVLKPLQDHLNLGDEASLKASTSPWLLALPCVERHAEPF